MMYDPDHYEEPTDPQIYRRAIRHALFFIVAFWGVIGLAFWYSI